MAMHILVIYLYFSGCCLAWLLVYMERTVYLRARNKAIDRIDGATDNEQSSSARYSMYKEDAECSGNFLTYGSRRT